jgi:hypothetical protein
MCSLILKKDLRFVIFSSKPIVFEQDWNLGDKIYRDGLLAPNESVCEKICKITGKKIGMNPYLYCDSCRTYFLASSLPETLTRIPVRERTWKCRK